MKTRVLVLLTALGLGACATGSLAQPPVGGVDAQPKGDDAEQKEQRQQSAEEAAAARLEAAKKAFGGEFPPMAQLGEGPLKQINIHPLFDESYACTPHPVGQLGMAGDALGTDCVVLGPTRVGERLFFVIPFRNDGLTNEDWLGWGEPVLAPFDGEVIGVSVNPIINDPGLLGPPPASLIIFRRADGVRLVYAHIAEPKVVAGDRVKAGQPIAVVGNNGVSRGPHIHIGAWEEDTLVPLEIRHDLRVMGELAKARRERQRRPQSQSVPAAANDDK